MHGIPMLDHRRVVSRLISIIHPKQASFGPSCDWVMDPSEQKSLSIEFVSTLYKSASYPFSLTSFPSPFSSSCWRGCLLASRILCVAVASNVVSRHCLFTLSKIPRSKPRAQECLIKLIFVCGSTIFGSRRTSTLQRLRRWEVSMRASVLLMDHLWLA